MTPLRVLLLAAAAVAVAGAGTGSEVTAPAPAKEFFKHRLTLPVLAEMVKDRAAIGVRSGDELLRWMGGGLDKLGYVNLCGVYLSHAWNAAAAALPDEWQPIPTRSAMSFERVTGSHAPGFYTTKDGEGMNIAPRVYDFHDFMLDAWGPPTATGADAIRSDAGKAGIIVFKNCPKWKKATGHVDIWFNGRCSGRCYFEDCTDVKLWAASGTVPCTAPVSNAAGAASASGVCADQDVCVRGGGGNKWPVLSSDCEVLGSRVKCCMESSSFQ